MMVFSVKMKNLILVQRYRINKIVIFSNIWSEKMSGKNGMGNTFNALCKKNSKLQQMTRSTERFQSDASKLSQRTVLMIMAHKSSVFWRIFFPWTWISSHHLLGNGGLTCFSLWFLKWLSRLRSRGILILEELDRAITAKNWESTKVIFILLKIANFLAPLYFLCQHFSMIEQSETEAN